MDTKRKTEYIFGGLAIFVFILFIYFFGVKEMERPYEVPVPESYPAGTNISLYQRAPQGFPKEIILEDKTLKYAGTVTSGGGKEQTKVSYISDKTVSSLTDLYLAVLQKNNFIISNKSVSLNVTVIKASRGEEKMIITLAPYKGSQVMATFQYEK